MKKVKNMTFFTRSAMQWRRRLFLSSQRRFSSSNNRKVVEIITKEDQMTIFQHVIRRPFRSYFKMASITFGLCFTGNLTTSLLDSERLEMMTSCPDIFSSILLIKCFQFGLIWPSFYIKALTSPREVFYIGGGWFGP